MVPLQADRQEKWDSEWEAGRRVHAPGVAARGATAGRPYQGRGAVVRARLAGRPGSPPPRRDAGSARTAVGRPAVAQHDSESQERNWWLGRQAAAIFTHQPMSANKVEAGSGVRFGVLDARKLPSADTLAGRVVVLDIRLRLRGWGFVVRRRHHPLHQRSGQPPGRLGGSPRPRAPCRLRSRSAFSLVEQGRARGLPRDDSRRSLSPRWGRWTRGHAHGFDGLYAGAKWVLGGIEPYEGADADARAVDTRRGEPGPIATRIDRALRARFRDETLKYRVNPVPGGADQGPSLLGGDRARGAPHRSAAGAGPQDCRALRGRRNVAYVEAAPTHPTTRPSCCCWPAARAVAVVRDSGSLAIAADFESGLDLIKLFDLGGGMPTRVSVPDSRLEEVLKKLAETVKGKGVETT